MAIESTVLELEGVLSRLESSVQTTVYDATPLILIQPPSARLLQADALRQQIAALDGHYSLFIKLEERLRDLRTRIHKQRSLCRSAASPISAMPLELLNHVFLLSVDTASDAWNISLVCSSWREVSSRQASLWTQVTVEPCDIRRVKALRPPSIQAPFHLTVSGRKDRPRIPLQTARLIAFGMKSASSTLR